MDEAICYKCEKNLDDEDCIGMCDGCCSSFHIKCVGVTKATIQARSNCNYLRLYCDICCNKPSKANAENIKTIMRYVAKLDLHNQENIIKQQQNDDLMRGVAAKLNELNDKYSVLSKNIEQSNKSNNNNESIPDVQTYAKVVKTKSIKPVVLIKPKAKQRCKKTFDDIKNNLIDKNFNVCDARNTKNGGLILRCDTANETMKIKQSVQEEFGDSYEINLPQIKKPRLRITNIDNDIHKNSIIDELKRHNKQIEAFDFDLITTIEKTKRGFKSVNAIVELSGSTHKQLLDIGVLHLPWRECKIYDHIYIKRCYKCCGFRHTSRICTKSQICSKCSKSHRYSECKNNEIKCINCSNANEKLNANLTVNHHAWSRECLILQRHISTLRNNIEYCDDK